MLADLFARFLARRLVRWALIAGFNLIGFASVAGIPIVLIVDILLVLTALQGILAVLQGTAAVVRTLVIKLFRMAAIGAAVCGALGLLTVIALRLFGTTDTAQELSAESIPMQAVVQDQENTTMPSAPVTQHPQGEHTAALSPAPVPELPRPGVSSANQVITLIDERNYAAALALVDTGADIVQPLNGRTPLTALEIDRRPDYYSEPDAYSLMKKLIVISSGLDQRLNDFGSILWHQLMYELGNNPQKFSEVLDILLARGIDINQKNFHGQTLADSATWSYMTQDIMIARGACSRLPNPVKPQQPVCKH